MRLDLWKMKVEERKKKRRVLGETANFDGDIMLGIKGVLMIGIQNV